ncbi:hypothetical protein T05_13339 [Trichinella murrelli]|uniref:Uncharacterized protein n=1 Tax=Trichinella murrelli TaxID=144512 RepID=A0A0V0SL16_9BILA|nr:hypothetical protein T05_13339 [Trichinella murrelli]
MQTLETIYSTSTANFWKKAYFRKSQKQQRL